MVSSDSPPRGRSARDRGRCGRPGPTSSSRAARSDGTATPPCRARAPRGRRRSASRRSCGTPSESGTGLGERSERPSTRNGSRMPSTSAIVGSTSIVRPQVGSIRPSACSGYFTNSGTVTMSCGVLLRQLAAVAEPPEDERRGGSRLDAERLAVVGREHHQRAVPEALAAQLPHQLAEQPVHVPGLEQVALEGLIGEERVVVGRRAVEARVALRAGLVALSRGQVLQRFVGQQRVDEVQRRALSRRGSRRVSGGSAPAAARRPAARARRGAAPSCRVSMLRKSRQRSLIGGRSSRIASGAMRYSRRQPRHRRRAR